MNCWVAPEVMLAVAGETEIAVTVGSTAVTVSVAVAVNPLAVALMVVVPAATPVARPAELTVATVGSVEAHVVDPVTLPVEPLL